MGDSPPQEFEDFVVERGPALHRTAVLLTHHDQAAVDLVQVALAKAWRTWSQIDSNPEAYVRRIIINEFTSASPRRWHGQQLTAELPGPHRDSDSGRILMRCRDAPLSAQLNSHNGPTGVGAANFPEAGSPKAADGPGEEGSR